MEFVDVALAVPGIVDLFLQTALRGYSVFSSVRLHGSQLGQYQWHLNRQEEV